jgi:rRNA maturation protein Nop10
LSLFAYLLPESFEDRKSTVQKLLTPKKINITGEIVNSAQMIAVNNNLSKNNGTNYTLKDNIIVEKGSVWKTPKPTIFSEKSSTGGGEVLEKIRQTYASMIATTIEKCCDIWHEPPETPDAYGQEGWMAYDGDYHYIYVDGRWRRQAIADFE